MNFFNDKLISNLLIAPKVLNDGGIDFLLDYIKKQEKIDLQTFDPNRSNQTGGIESVLEKSIRNTQTVKIDGVFEDLYFLYKDIVNNIINPFYEFKIKDSEIPQILCYDVGGHYKTHIDSESLWKTPKGELMWRKNYDRDLSTIIFLNDDFEGGNLYFPELKISIKPEKGLLVCFPSNHLYPHMVEPVTSGKRFSIVNWMTVDGMESKEEQEKRILQEYGVV